MPPRRRPGSDAVNKKRAGEAAPGDASIAPITIARGRSRRMLLPLPLRGRTMRDNAGGCKGMVAWKELPHVGSLLKRGITRMVVRRTITLRIKHPMRADRNGSFHQLLNGIQFPV